MFPVRRLADWFAERSARGMLTRAVGAWLLVGLPVIAARIWWSVAAAITVFVVAVTVYVAAAVRYMHHHRRQL
jgi:membrane protein YdbS with pleckstrin-like domain